MFTRRSCVTKLTQRLLDIIKNGGDRGEVERLSLPTLDVVNDLRSFLTLPEINKSPR